MRSEDYNATYIKYISTHSFIFLGGNEFINASMIFPVNEQNVNFWKKQVLCLLKSNSRQKRKHHLKQLFVVPGNIRRDE